MSVERRGPRTFVARIKVDGRSRQRTFETMGAAREWERTSRVDVRRGDWIDPTAGSIKFSEYAASWMDIAALRWRDSTEREVRRRVARFLIPALGDRPLRAITRSECQGIVSRLAAEGRKPKYIRNVRATLAAILTAAVDDQLIPSNPAARLTMPKAEAQPITPLTVEQVEYIAYTIRPELSAFVTLGAASGLRSGEMRALVVGDIFPAVHIRRDLPHVPVTIRVRRGVDDAGVIGPPKSPAANRDVQVPARIAEVLAEHIATHGLGDNGLIFHGPSGGPWATSTLANFWHEAIDGLGLSERHGVHQLRHHHASLLLSQGINIAAVSRRLGHSNVTTTLRSYSWVMAGDEARIMRVLGETGTA
jgi:integrase